MWVVVRGIRRWCTTAIDSDGCLSSLVLRAAPPLAPDAENSRCSHHGIALGAIIEKLVARTSETPTAQTSTDKAADEAAYADYNGEWINGLFDSVTKRIDITTGRREQVQDSQCRRQGSR